MFTARARNSGAAADTLSADPVVSPRLAVHDLDKLHVADASVMPAITRGSTRAPAIMIAEKAASILAAC